MRLININVCPISGRSGEVIFAATRDAFFGTEGLWNYRRDAQSGHMWLDPRPAEEDIASIYTNYYTHDEATGGDETLWSRAMAVALQNSLGYPLGRMVGWRARLLAWMPSVKPAAELEVMRIPSAERGRLLDYGCGSGTFLKRMRSYGWHVSGIEPDASSAARVAEREQLDVYASIDEARRAGGLKGFDVITMSHVIEHLPDPIRTLQELRSLLASGGRLVVTTPNAESLGARIFCAHWRGLEPPRHFNIFTSRSLHAAMEAGGFEVQSLSTEVRLARGIWFMSALARSGGGELETAPRSAHTALKLAGYVFQILEAAVVTVAPLWGEELFCSATPKNAA